MKTSHVLMIAGGGLLAAYALKTVADKGIGGAASGLASAAVDAVGGLFSGTVLGIGDAVGLPRTNVSAGQAAWNSGNYLEASKLLPAGDFLGNVWGALTGSGNAPRQAVDPALELAKQNAALYGGTVEGWYGFDYIDQGAVDPRSMTLSPSKWGTRTTAGFPWER